MKNLLKTEYNVIVAENGAVGLKKALKFVPDLIISDVIMPEMVGGIAEVYSGRYWTPVEIKADMIGQYLAEYSMTYKPVKHGKVGHGATRGSKFVSLR